MREIQGRDRRLKREGKQKREKRERCREETEWERHRRRVGGKVTE
jgi:hypothetical protein